MSIDSDNKDNNKFVRNLDNLREMESEIDEESDDVEDLVSVTQRINKAFYNGNGNISGDYRSPEEMLRDYEDFN